MVLYCLMKVKAESDELYEKLVRKHFYGRSDDILAAFRILFIPLPHASTSPIWLNILAMPLLRIFE